MAKLNKTCARCRANKTLDFFGVHKSTKDGFRVYCKECEKLFHKERKAKHPEQFKKYNENAKIRAYGIEPNEYYNLLRNQNFVCAICKRPNRQGNRKLHIDHCHKTGKIRGLLCHGCNSSLGLMDENKTYLANAIVYLKIANEVK